MKLFTNFEGRISRSSFWYGIIVIAIVGIGLGLLLISLLPPGFLLKGLQLIFAGCLAFAMTAIVVKRLHDRNKPALPYSAIFLGPSFLNTLMSIFGIGYTSTQIGGIDLVVPGVGALILGYVSLAVSMWMLIELGMLRGTHGENTYGADPTVTSKPEPNNA